jgi:hypothetical protein
MSSFFTRVDLPKPFEILDFDSSVCSIGSCFSLNLSNHFEELGMPVAANPSGIIYNTLSMQMIMDACRSNRIFQCTDFFQHRGMWSSWLHHGSFSKKRVCEAVEHANKALKIFRDHISQCDLVLLTPSSSIVYQHKDCDFVAANCHRVPNGEFSRRVLSVDENREALLSIIADIRQMNKKALVVLTLSPVRHYRRELTLNSQSKANLLSAIHQVVSLTGVHYFPSYEIMVDELRDYRFYAEDMLHPSELARKIIFQKFIKTYFVATAETEYASRLKKLKHSHHRSRYEF